MQAVPGLARAHNRLVNLLHRRRRRSLDRRGRVVIRCGRFLLLIDVETERDHAVDALRERRRVVEREAGLEQCRLEEEEGEVADGLVRLVLRDLLAQLLNDGVVRVKLKRLLRCHVRRHRRITKSLRLHDALLRI